MAVRTGMFELIAQLRLLVGDPAGAEAVFSNLELQDFLDNWRTDVFTLPLLGQASTQAGGAAIYRDYYSDLAGAWEGNELLQDGSFNTIAATSAERKRGHWQFSAGQSPPVFITGACYDLNRAAINVIDAWIAKIKLEFDFDADGGKFNRSQKVQGLLQLRAHLAVMCAPMTAAMVRRD